MTAIDPAQVLREKVNFIDRVLEQREQHTEELKREKTALMVAIVALERESKGGKS